MNAVEIYEKASWGVDHSKITLGEFEERIKPLYDVEPVRHGKWSHDYIKDGIEYSDWFNLHCSVCGQMQRDAWGKWDYCPYCGAKMDEMSDYIKKEDAWDITEEFLRGRITDEQAQLVIDIEGEIEAIPSADVVEVSKILKTADEQEKQGFIQTAKVLRELVSNEQVDEGSHL